MAMKVEHALHRRRLSRNVGLGLVLVLYVGLVYGLTIAKLGGPKPNTLPAAEARE